MFPGSPSFDPFEPPRGRRERPLRNVPIRVVLPNLVTLLALCSGLTSIRMTLEERYSLAILAVVFAAVLDGVDGRVARLLKSTSRFGAELDSLADFVNFGVAPAILLYGWTLGQFRSIGWLVALVFAIGSALRLARFNTAPAPEGAGWQANYFVGVPAPAGALTVLLPLYLEQMGLAVPSAATAVLVLIYALMIGFLMVSRLPTFSGKSLGTRIRRDLVVPALVGIIVLVGLLVSYPFTMLAIGSSVYLVLLPLGWRSFVRTARAQERLAGAAPGPEPVSAHAERASP